MSYRKKSDKRFSLFKRTCNRYLKKYDLLDWDVAYEYHVFSAMGDQGKVDYDISTKKATIILYKFSKRNSDVRLIAFHEVTHLLFADLMDGISECVNTWKRAWINKKEHKVIEKLEKVLFP